MEFRILGPLQVLDENRELPLGGAKQRALLALLLLDPNRVISRERLIDELWHTNPPETAPTALQVYVSQLRKALGRDLILTQPPGYLIRVSDDELDLHRFGRLVATARAEEPAEAARLLREGLALWRGAPLAELDDSFARAERARLEEQRLAALEQRIQADLALGRHADLVPELEGLVREHPLRERLRCQLMLALYRCGRQADALEVYRSVRRLLDEELGLEPDDTADAVWVANGSDGTVARIDPSADAVVETIDLRGSSELVWNPAYAVAADDDSVWIAAGPRHVLRIDPTTNEPSAIIDVGHVPIGVALGEEALWVVTTAERALRIEPHTSTATTEVPIGDPVALTAGKQAVWVSDMRGQVWRINPDTGTVTQTTPVGRGLVGLCATNGAVFAANNADGTVVQIDPQDGRVVGVVPVGHAPTDVASWDGTVWVSIQSESAM